MGKSIAELMVSLGADITDYEKKFAKAAKVADKNLEGLKDFGQGMSLYVTAPILAAATAIAVWTAEEETADARLSSSLRNVGVSYADVTDGVHGYISSLEQLSGFGDTEIQNTFTKLINITGSASTAMGSLATVTDVAAGTGAGLEQVSMAVGKALDGETTALKRMGIRLQENMSPLQVLTALQEKFGGAAAKVAATVEGKWNQIKNSFQNVAETMGKALEPTTKAIEDSVIKIIGWLQKGADFFAQQPEHIKKFVVALLAITAAIGPLLVAFATLGGAILTVGAAIAAGGGWAVVVGTLKAIAVAAWAAIAPFIAWPALIAAVIAVFAIFYANGKKIAAGLGGIFFTLASAFSAWIGGLLNDMASLASVIPGFGEKIAGVLEKAAKGITTFSKYSAEAAQELANDYEASGGYIENTGNLIKGVWESVASAIGLNTATINASVAGMVPPLEGLGAPLDASKKKWAEWAASLKITVQQLATSIHGIFAGIAVSMVSSLAQGTFDAKRLMFDFLVKMLEASVSYAVANMLIFQTMAAAIAAALTNPIGAIFIIGGLIAAVFGLASTFKPPALAAGGMTTGETLATIGDNPSGKELVLPLDSPQTTNALSKAMPAGGAGEQTIIVQIGDETIAQAAVRGMPSIIRLSGVGA